MSRAYLSGVVVMLLSVAACFYGGLGTSGAEPEGVVKVLAADLGSGKVVVIGRLGIPLKTMMTVRGMWHYPDQSKGPTKDYDLWFHVTHVNGEPLAKPVQFHRTNVDAVNDNESDRKEVKPSDGDAWELRAYETGGFRQAPGTYWKELRTGIPQYPVAHIDNFVSELHGIVQTSGKPAKVLRQGEKRVK